MVFSNREQAALMLISKLEVYRGRNPLILAIPRGAVPMGEILVNALGGELDVLLVGKIGAEESTELAIGAVTDTGLIHVDPTAAMIGYDRAAVERLAHRKMALLQQRRQLLAPLVRPVSPTGRIVIIVDDGIATGATMTLAVQAVRASEPGRIVVAVPVASAHAVTQLKHVADEVIALQVPAGFRAVSQYYDEFGEVSDEEVIRLLSESRKKKPLREAVDRGTTPIFPQHEPPS